MGEMIKISVDDTELQVMLWRLERSAKNTTPLMKQFGLYMMKQIKSMFQENGKGGEWRGVHWNWFSESMYDSRRKPPGRLRHSGKRVTASSRIMIDTGILRKSIMPLAKKHELQIVARSGYSAYANDIRPFMFATEDDISEFKRRAREWITKG